MATTTTNFGWDIPQSTDLVKDGATAIAALGQDIDTALVDLKGGTTGQVLAKASNTDLDYSWVAIDPLLILDAKGDLITATAADTPARLPVGANGTVLTADSSQGTGLRWATPSGGGKVLQVVTVNPSTTFTTTSTSYVDATNYTATITPTLSTSKVLVLFNYTHNSYSGAGSTNTITNGRLLRGSTTIFTRTYGVAGASGTWELRQDGAMMLLDEPATTSATTYKLQLSVNPTMTGQAAPSASIVLMEIGA